MKFIQSIVLILIFVSSIFADNTSSYILITKTSKKSNLKYIKKTLDSLNVKMFIQKQGRYYMVYSQKYNKEIPLHSAYNRIKQHFHTARIVTKEQPKKSASQLNSANVKSDKNNMFVSFGIGSSNIKGSTDDANVSTLETSGLSLSLEAGYYFNKNIFVSLAYLNTSTNDITIHNVYASCNYQIDFLKDFSAYGGVLVGLGTLQLIAYDQSEPSVSMLYGGQIGLEFKVFDNISLYTSSQLLLSNHKISLLTTGNQVTYSALNNIKIGVEYRF